MIVCVRESVCVRAHVHACMHTHASVCSWMWRLESNVRFYYSRHHVPGHFVLLVGCFVCFLCFFVCFLLFLFLWVCFVFVWSHYVVLVDLELNMQPRLDSH